jgi:hypothetical protein
VTGDAKEAEPSENRQLLADTLPEMPRGQERLWAVASEGTGLRPLECKAIYGAGLIRHLVESSGYCFTDFHLAAYQLVVCCFEPLGAMVTGRKMTPDETLSAGLRYAARLPDDCDTKAAVVASTWHGGDYTIRDCVDRRHFTAHGGRSVSAAGVVLDAELNRALLRHAVDGLDRWWSSLIAGHRLTQLANAQLVPLAAGGVFVFGGDLASALLGGGTPGGAVLHQDEWR